MVHEYLARFQPAGLHWPLDEEWEKERLEAALFLPASPRAGPCPTLSGSPVGANIESSPSNCCGKNIATSNRYCYSPFCKLDRRWKKR